MQFELLADLLRRSPFGIARDSFREVCADNFARWAAANDGAMIEPERARAELRYDGHVVAHHQHRASRVTDVFHLAKTLPLKRRISDGAHFVDDEHLRLEMRGH